MSHHNTKTIINCLFLILVLTIFSSVTCNSRQRKDYLLEFEFPLTENKFLEPYLDMFEDVKTDSTKNSDEEEYEYEYINPAEEDEDDINDLAYVNEMYNKFQTKLNNNNIDSYGIIFKNMIKKTCILSSLRNAKIYYGQAKTL